MPLCWWIGISGNLLAANAAATALYGYSREELLSLNRIDLSAEPEKTIQATMEMQTVIPLRWHRKKDGTVFPVEISGCYFDLKGRSVFVSAIRDITNRRLSEAALKNSEEKFSKAFYSNPAAIVIIDLTSESYLEVNRTFEQLTGFRRNEVVGHHQAELSLDRSSLSAKKSSSSLRRKALSITGNFIFAKRTEAKALACFRRS